ncbi:unnamed protein product [Schistosoma margrebowiei]|uniref:Uncharacterized protein n=1 Tax=Schistosoma margrebowiei TaxID=48269 RepID=A0A183M1F3_9TREM|nr:unnamed protein product [Schistosoma margrebowiei]
MNTVVLSAVRVIRRLSLPGCPHRERFLLEVPEMTAVPKGQLFEVGHTRPFYGNDPTRKYFFVRYVCTYGRKRSSSESDACVQDVDDDSNNHSSEEHTTSNSPTQPRQRRRRRSSTYALLQMNLSFRSKYCHCQSGFWVRAVNGELNLTSIKTVYNHPCTEGYISVDPSKRQLTSSERLYLRTFLLSNTPTSSLRYLVPMSFRTLVNEFTSFAAKIVAVNYKRVRTMRHEFIEREYIRCYDYGMMYVVDTSRARCACERFSDYLLPCDHILYAHSKDLIRGGMCVPLSL